MKAWFTDLGNEIASTGVQIHGGMGFIEETGAAQHLRDARILPIYEGTNGIQARDLVGRKIAKDGGETMLGLIAEMRATAEELKANPHAALLFHWKSLRRQVRIEGPVGPVDPAQADDYFATRSRESQLGAWASDQSRTLASRAELENRFAAAMDRFAIGDVPRPPGWSGYRVTPERFEFWTDRPHRLHERRLFLRDGDGWQESLLYP